MTKHTSSRRTHLAAASARRSSKTVDPVPGLNAFAPYSSRLSARSALYPEFHQLLEARAEALPSKLYRSIVVDENRLAKSSKAARAKTWKELKSRYRLSNDDPLFSAFWAEWSRCQSDTERTLTAYVLFALNDRLVLDLGISHLYHLMRRAPSELRVADIRAFLDRACLEHPEVRSWSDETRNAVAQKYTASIRDFGLAQGKVRKSMVRPALYAAPIRLIVRALVMAGIAPLEIVISQAFRLLGLDATEVVPALGKLNGIGALRFRMQGDVVELDVLGD